MEIEYTLPFRRGSRQRTFLSPPVREPDGRAPRLARMLALAHKTRRAGSIGRDSGLCGDGPPGPCVRVSQLPDFAAAAFGARHSGAVLFLDAARAHPLTEKDLRRVAREPNWDRQRVLLENLLRPN